MNYDPSFVNVFGEKSDLREKDIMLFNPKNSTISFKRMGEYLRFDASPAKDYFRHVYFIRRENDFNELAQLVSKINGLQGRRIMNDDNILLWEFTNSPLEKIQIFYGATITYNPEISSINISSSSNEDSSISMIISFLKSEKDFFELANLTACINKCLCRDIEETPNSKTCSINLIPS